jgi:hypothetical protein
MPSVIHNSKNRLESTRNIQSENYAYAFLFFWHDFSASFDFLIISSSAY